MCCKGKRYVFCSVPVGFNHNPKVPIALFFTGLTSVFWYLIGISDSMWKSSVYFSSTIDYSPVCANCPLCACSAYCLALIFDNFICVVLVSNTPAKTCDSF